MYEKKCKLFANVILFGFLFANFLHTWFCPDSYMQTFRKRGFVQVLICKLFAYVFLFGFLFANFLHTWSAKRYRLYINGAQ